MAEYRWRLTNGESDITGLATDIARAIEALSSQLDQLAATSIPDYVEGRIDGPDVTLPFSIGWGPLQPVLQDDPGRDIPATQWDVQELVEALRSELHRTADARSLASG